MSYISGRCRKERVGFRKTSAIFNGNGTVVNNNGQSVAKKRETVVEWLNNVFTDLNLPNKASDEELRAYLIDNSVLRRILSRMCPDSTNEVSDLGSSSASYSENVDGFLAAMDVLGLPKFKMYDLEKGSMVPVINCLFTLKAQFTLPIGKHTLSEIPHNASTREFISASSKEERLKVLSSKLRNTRHSSLQSVNRFPDVFQLKQGRYADIPAERLVEMMKSTSIDNAPTQSLLSVVNGILDESVEKKNGEIPHRVACLLRKVVQEIERRISAQALHLKTQNNIFKAREEKYQTRIRVLEDLASGTGDENQRAEKAKLEEKIEADDEGMVIRWMKEKDRYDLEISSLKRELELSKKAYETKCLQMEERARNEYDLDVSSMEKEAKGHDDRVTSQLKNNVKTSDEMKFSQTVMYENDDDLEISSLKQEIEAERDENAVDIEISSLKRELEEARQNYKAKCLEFETQAKDQYGHESSSMQQQSVVEKRNDDHSDIDISSLKQELQEAKKKYELKCSEKEAQSDIQILLKQELEEMKSKYAIEKQAKEKYNLEVSSSKQELETVKQNYEMQCSQVKTQAMGAETELEKKVEELQRNLQDSTNKVRYHEEKVSELERNLEESKNEVRDHKEKIFKLERNLEDARNRVKKIEADAAAILSASKTKQRIYQGFMDSQFGALKELRSFGGSIKNEVLRSQTSYSEELSRVGPKLMALARAAEDYHTVLAENRKLFNEVQDLKGNIRVFCRVRPFLPKQTGRQKIIERCGENGELVIVNPSKQAKDGVRSFKFNKVFGPASSQAEVYSETQPFVRSVLDGFNACIFAYGQTGSGKTHTMSGPKGGTKEEWGINFRALDDLFTISQNRRSSIAYEVGVQMVEIYNEQVRDLLSSDGSQKKIGIVTNSQASGLAVPDATLKNVNSTSDVIALMDAGLKNRTVSATAMNERSSRSHSIITIHVHGTDVKTGAALRGSLHLVDLAGSERVDRSEVTGDRLKEAQHINKSLAALGDVIYALAQKSNHIPYRNSKLTQLLQTSLGGQAKTLMFVQVNPDSISYTETLSTLKFAERVSGVELGAARSSKDAKGDAKELMDQVTSLKDTISKKGEEIEQLQVLKDLKNGYPAANVEKQRAAR